MDLGFENPFINSGTLLLLNGLSLSSFLVSHGSATGREEERPSKQELKHLETIYLRNFFFFSQAVKEILSLRYAAESIQ